MFIGIFVVAFSGHSVLRNYDVVSIYSKAIYLTLGIGLAMVVFAYLLQMFSTYKESRNEKKKDNRDFINQWEQKGMFINKWLLGLAILTLIFAAFQSWALMFRLLKIYFFIGMAFIGFLYVMKGARVEEPDDLDFKGRTRKFLDIIDYRRHPFNLSLLVYILVIGSFLLSKQFDIPMYMEVSGNPRYVTSLPVSTFVMSGLMVTSTYIYIINNGDLFGIQKAQQNELKVLQIHFAEIISCGVTFFLWIVIVIEALIIHFG